jgi:LytR cell envelope-related transcriptional attenuator
LTRRLGLVLGLVVILLGVGGALASSRVRTAVFGVPSGATAPRGVRVRVEVLNATLIRGLGRRATELLRDRGFDVVDVGTTSARERGDSTFVLDRSGHPDWAARVAQAMGQGARVISRPDSSRYLDVTVLVGATWRPPPQPFHP